MWLFPNRECAKGFSSIISINLMLVDCKDITVDDGFGDDRDDDDMAENHGHITSFA
jgi:hypothetical protein